MKALGYHQVDGSLFFLLQVLLPSSTLFCFKVSDGKASITSLKLTNIWTSLPQLNFRVQMRPFFVYVAANYIPIVIARKSPCDCI